MDLKDTLKDKQWKQTNYSAPTLEEKEKAGYESYKQLKAIAKSRVLEITKVRRLKVIDPITDKSFLQMVVGLEDYDGKKDKNVYLACINVDNKDTPRLYEFIDKEVTRLSHEFRE